MKEKLEKELSNLPKDFVVLTILPKEQFRDLNLHLVDIMVNQKKIRGAYVSVNWSYPLIVKMMQKRGIDHKNLFFIDCISKGLKTEADNCLFLESAQSLTNISISLEPIYRSKEDYFILLDSLDALSLYHKTNLIVRFARNLIDKVRKHNKSGVIVGLHEETDSRIITDLSMVCDKVIDLT